MMAMFIDNSSDTSIRISDFSRQLECSTTRIIRYMNDIDELEKRGLVICSRERGRISYRVPWEVIEAFKRNEKFVPRDCSGLSCEVLFGVIEEIMEMRDDNEMTTKMTVQRLEHLLECNRHLVFVQKLKSMNVKVGLPVSAGGRLRFILAVQEHGSPLMRIPSRPVIRPALAKPETRSAMAGEMRNALQAAWEGDEGAARAAMESAGQAGADGIRKYIDSHIPPANSPVTVNGGWIYNRKAHKAVYVPGKGKNKPLFDTGALYAAFDYEIEE